MMARSMSVFAERQNGELIKAGAVGIHLLVLLVSSYGLQLFFHLRYCLIGHLNSIQHFLSAGVYSHEFPMGCSTFSYWSLALLRGVMELNMFLYVF